MPTPKKGPRLGSSPSHQRKILANLSRELIYNRSIKTTEAKAKTLQPYFEKLVTKAKSGTIHDRRNVSRKITDRDAVYELFDVLVPEIDPERNGGYTRITRIGNRRGDNAPMCVIEVVTEPVMKKRAVKSAEKVAAAAVAKQVVAEEIAEEIVEEVLEVEEAVEEALVVEEIVEAVEAAEAE